MNHPFWGTFIYGMYDMISSKVMPCVLVAVAGTTGSTQSGIQRSTRKSLRGAKPKGSKGSQHGGNVGRDAQFLLSLPCLAMSSVVSLVFNNPF